MPEDPGALSGLAATFALNLGVALMVGAAASLAWSASYPSEWATTARTRSARCLQVGVFLTMGATVIDLWSRSANAAGVSALSAWPAVHSMLVRSHFGRFWIIGTVALVAVFGFQNRRARPGRTILASAVAMLVCLAIYGYTRSAVSHAAAEGDASIAVANDWTHLMLIALWVGLVFVASFTRFDPKSATDRDDAAAWIGWLSRAATIALFGILLTGAFNTWRSTKGALGTLPGSGYGTRLFLKLGLVFVSIALGAHNRFRTLPTMLAQLKSGDSSAASLHRFQRLVRIEAFTLAAALAAAAVLSNTEPTGGG